MINKMNGESIGTQINELNVQYQRVPRRKWRFRAATAIFILFSIIMCMILSSARHGSKERKIRDYLNQNDTESLLMLYDDVMLRGDERAFEWYEENLIGINSNTALAGLSRNCDGNLDNKNQIRDTSAYTDSNGKLHVFLGEKEVFSPRAVVPEVILTHHYAFYIIENNNTLCRYNIDDGVNTIIWNEPVDRFMIYGKYIFLLGKDEIVRKVDFDGNEEEKVVGNVQRFFVVGDLIVQDGVNIYKVSLDGRKSEKIVKDAFLVGAGNECVYFINFGVSPEEMLRNQKNGEEISNDQIPSEKYVVFALSLNDGSITPIDGRAKFIRAVYVVDEGIYVDTVD